MEEREAIQICQYSPRISRSMGCNLKLSSWYRSRPPWGVDADMSNPSPDRKGENETAAVWERRKRRRRHDSRISSFLSPLSLCCTFVVVFLFPLARWYHLSSLAGCMGEERQEKSTEDSQYVMLFPPFYSWFYGMKCAKSGQ